MRLNLLFAAIAIMVSIGACALSGDVKSSDRPSGGYSVSANSSIHAGSALNLEQTAINVSGYYGQYRVKDSGKGQGCCFDKQAEGSNSRPKGALLIIWRAFELGDENMYSEFLDYWYPKPLNARYFYAVAQLSDLPPYPAKIKEHLLYRTFLSAGKVTVSEKGLRPEDAAQAIAFVTNDEQRLKRYVFGREDAVYNKVLSVGRDGIEVVDDPSPWQEIPGVAITEEQYWEFVKCSPDSTNCRSFLSINDADLTPEQREYVRMHPITKADMREVIKSLERYQRRLDRWQ